MGCGIGLWRDIITRHFPTASYHGVPPYLSLTDLKRALHNLGLLSQGALYAEAVTGEDFARDIADEDITDPRIFRHRAEVYRRGLSPLFHEVGGGLWLSRQAEVTLFSLEYAAE